MYFRGWCGGKERNRDREVKRETKTFQSTFKLFLTQSYKFYNLTFSVLEFCFGYRVLLCSVFCFYFFFLIFNLH